ncbi:hypothetical protein [Erythrobacter sp. WG]|uniref:hypothetical protein n=1 Tax=Erythrobacter sp. WG TaxID=2985510 RepID=UPI00226E5AC5|nr:hypothetical protein [Erythrobacter sp. WG]MCX9148514.1 hypothetical protein [Erythrobacter sp. WG]
MQSPELEPLPVATRPPQSSQGQPSLSLVRNQLCLARPDEAPSAEWADAFDRVAGWAGLDIRHAPRGGAGVLRQRAGWAWGRGAARAPIFAPWLSHPAAAFQDPRRTRDLAPARWVASYLWDPCAGRPGRTAAIDAMLVSPHPAACRMDEECGVSLPGSRLLHDMIGAAEAEGRSRIAVIGHERSRSALARHMLAGKVVPGWSGLALEVLAIEEALARLAGDPGGWDAIIVMPELRSLIVTLLAELSGIRGPWPMLWQGDTLHLVSAETALGRAGGAPLDAALLVQSLALAARNGGNLFAARRLAEGWARLRDRGVVTETRGSPAPYVTQLSDAECLARLCAEDAAAGRPVAPWKAVAAPAPNAAPASVPCGTAASRITLVATR